MGGDSTVTQSTAEAPDGQYYYLPALYNVLVTFGDFLGLVDGDWVTLSIRIHVIPHQSSTLLGSD